MSERQQANEHGGGAKHDTERQDGVHPGHEGRGGASRFSAGTGGRLRYVVPSLLTCTSTTLAFFAIAEAVARRFESSAWLILLCVILDKADGSAARLLKASSRFGVELDSLSDLICFGLAPAVLALSVMTETPPEPLLGVVPVGGYMLHACCALYVVAAMLRLAKFNVVTESYGNQYFFGIPTTAVGSFVTCQYLAAAKYGLTGLYVQCLPLQMVILALAMVSRIPLRKIGPRKSLAGNVGLFGTVLTVYTFVILRVFPEAVLAAGSTYMIGGSIWATLAGVRPPSVAAQGGATEDA